MKNIIEIYDLKYKINTKTILNDIKIKIASGSTINLIGKNQSGKTILLKLIGGLIITDNQIKIDGEKISKFNIENKKKKVFYMTTNNEYFSKTVY